WFFSETDNRTIFENIAYSSTFFLYQHLPFKDVDSPPMTSNAFVESILIFFEKDKKPK
ncbi:conserved hypothetical protein, partial [Trichinella spiralis]|uniref:hypothetical protein n=1 Tax=Trichinella spiralis TaxID=6334 RepID=UPI0001EFEB66